MDALLGGVLQVKLRLCHEKECLWHLGITWWPSSCQDRKK